MGNPVAVDVPATAFLDIRPEAFVPLQPRTAAPARLVEDPVEPGQRMDQDDLKQRVAAIEKVISIRKLAKHDKKPIQVLPGLYIGGIGAARNAKALNAYGVTHVLNASPVVPCFHRPALAYKVVCVFDDAEADIAQHFEEVNDFIEQGRKGGGVLVNCFAGQSRSATFVLAYLIAKEGMDFVDAWELLRRRRPVVNPNSGFMLQLLRYAQEMGRCQGRFLSDLHQ